MHQAHQTVKGIKTPEMTLHFPSTVVLGDKTDAVGASGEFFQQGDIQPRSVHFGSIDSEIITHRGVLVEIKRSPQFRGKVFPFQTAEVVRVLSKPIQKLISSPAPIDERASGRFNVPDNSFSNCVSSLTANKSSD